MKSRSKTLIAVSTALVCAGTLLPSTGVTAAVPVPTVAYNFEGTLVDSAGGSSLTLTDSCDSSPAPSPCLSESGFGTSDGDGYWEWSSSDPRGGGFTIETDEDLTETYSMMVKFSFATMSGYNKIVDYKDAADDTGFYIYNRKINFYDLGTGTKNFSPNSVLDLVVTRDGSDDTFTVYAKQGADLVQLLQVEDPDGEGIPNSVGGKSKLGFFFDDQDTSSEGTESGRVYSIKMWEGIALTEAEVETEVSSGGIQPLPENSDLGVGESKVTLDGQEVDVTISRSATAVTMTGGGFAMSIEGASSNGEAIELDSNGNIYLRRGGIAHVSGNGFKPNSEVQVYLFSDAIALGALTTNANGEFDGDVPIPSDVVVGVHTIQANGLTPDDLIRSVNLGVTVPSELPPTGSNIPALLTLVLALLALGSFGLVLHPKMKKSIR